MNENTEKMEEYDLMTIGAGPAGLTAAMYAARLGLKTAFFETANPISQLALAPFIENYPGFEGKGFELLEKIKKQAIKFGAEYKLEKVKKLQKSDKGFLVITESKKYKTKTLIIATGGKHRELGVQGEKEFIGKGVSYCAVCDGNFFRGKNVLTVGGGNTAVEEAIYLKEIGCKVSLVHRRDKLRAEKALQEEFFKHDIPVIWNSTVKRIEGNKKVEKVVLFNRITNEEFSVQADGVFIAIGIKPETDLVVGLGVERDSAGYIRVDKRQATNISGVFAAGDCCNNPLKQIVTACADGAIAASSAFEYLKILKM
jgi:thioredoxin reductase (NADPH)